jgi:thiamine-monophosphate kinase
MIDLSDGLSTDLRRLVRESGTGAEIDSSALPVFESSSAWGCDPLELGLYGGEDYELLFSVPPARSAALERHYPSKYPRISRIGKLIPEPGVVVMVKQPGARRRRLPDLGFDHFKVQRTGPKPLPGSTDTKKPPESRKKTKQRPGSKRNAKQLSFDRRIE